MSRGQSSDDAQQRCVAEAEPGRENRATAESFWSRALLDTPHNVFALDPEKRILAVSRALAARLGVEPDALVGRTCAAVMHGNGHDPAGCPFADLLADGAAHACEMQCEVLGGDFFVTVTPVPDADGRVAGVVHTAWDITARTSREDDLRRREERFAELFHNAPLGYQSLDEDGRFLEVNALWLQTLGYQRAEVIGRWFGEFLAPEHVAAFRTRFPRFKELGEVRCEFEMVRKDGERRTIAFEGRIGRHRDGSFKQTHCILSDITEAKRAEAALRESEARFRNVVENTPVAIFQSTVEGRGVYFSPAFATLFGFDTSTELLEAVNASSIQDVLYAEPARRGELVEDVRAAAGEWKVFENVYRRKDGSLMEAVLYLCEHADADTGETYLYGYVQDVTSERGSRRALEKHAALLEKAEELAHLGSWEWDLRSEATLYSKAWQRVYGVDRDEFSESDGLALIHPDDVGVVADSMERVRKSGVPYRARYRIIRQNDGEIRHVEGYGSPVLNAGGEVVRVYGASLDVTESVKAREALEEREQRLQQALAGAVAALGATVRLRDPYTAGHEVRVAELVASIAERLGWEDTEIEMVRTAALVHDIGKIGIPAEILSKPTKLSEMEFTLVKDHSRAGYEILAPIAFGSPIADVVLQHHERLDGSGYPAGLKGDEILPAALVLAVADVVEAMTSHRPYRAALPLGATVTELRDGMGVLYQPEATTVCLDLIEEGFCFATEPGLVL